MEQTLKRPLSFSPDWVPAWTSFYDAIRVYADDGVASSMFTFDDLNLLAAGLPDPVREFVLKTPRLVAPSEPWTSLNQQHMAWLMHYTNVSAELAALILSLTVGTDPLDVKAVAAFAATSLRHVRSLIRTEEKETFDSLHNVNWWTNFNEHWLKHSANRAAVC